MLTAVLIVAGIMLFRMNPELWESEPIGKQNKTSEGLLVHEETGLVDAEGLQQVIVNCTGCHSSRLITQNRATRAGWLSMIRWMQGTQGLWDLGENEDIILNYLSKYYKPQKTGRRANLTEIQWYPLEQ